MSDAKPWEDFYGKTATNRLPWHSGAPDSELTDLVRRGIVRPCRALDVGCGQGTESVFLALARFRVTGLDLSAEALRRARKLAALLGAHVDFRRGDVLDMPFARGRFGLVNDRGCFHHIDPERRGEYAREVSRVLKPGGFLFLRCFSDKAAKGRGPHCIRRRELREALGETFRIRSILLYPSLGNDGPPTTPLYACLAQK